MDGICNGYQHLSAMGRDPVGGRATNLVPAEDRTFLLYREDETRQIDSRKQADGIVAHLVHSMDTAH
jgi:DNA-directed RNA polymerase